MANNGLRSLAARPCLFSAWNSNLLKDSHTIPAPELVRDERVMAGTTFDVDLENVLIRLAASIRCSTQGYCRDFFTSTWPVRIPITQV